MAEEFEERFRLITEAISDVFFIATRDPCRMIYVSPAYERIWGRSVEALYTNPDSFCDAIHPDDRALVSTYVPRRDTYEHEYRIVDGTGAIRWIRDRSFPVERDGVVAHFVGVATDITESKRVSTEHADMAERLRMISTATNDGLWEWDIVTGNVWWTEQNFTLYGLDPSTMPSYEVWVNTIHPDDRDAVVGRFAAALEDGTTSTVDEYRVLRPDGGVLEVSDRACIIRDAAGKPLRVVGALQDITARRELERQLRQVQKMEAIGQLAGGIAHDFNNILQAAILELALLQGTAGLPESAVVRTTELRSIVERAANLTRQLLVFSRREAMRPQRIDVNNRIVDVVRLLRRVIGESVSLHLELASGVLAASADPSMLDQVLINLAVNARDAMPDGGALTIETSLRPHNGRRHICISVRDTGTGITADALPRIFEPFYTTKDAGRGTGLGLATVHGIVEQHGGSIEVISERGRGTTFDVFLPALENTDVDDSAPPPPMLVTGHETILVVEDDTPVRTALRALLEASGYRVVEAERGIAALASWDELAGKIDLVLTDLVMPGGMSGGELADRLMARRADVPIIFVTGYSPDVSRCDKHELLNKPIDPEHLLRTVRATLDRALS